MESDHYRKTVYVSVDLHKQAKAVAAEAGLSMRQLMERAIINEMRRVERKTRS